MLDPRGKGQMSTRAEATVAGGDRPGDAHVCVASAPSKGFCSVRHGLALILQFCNFTLCTQSMNLSITMPVMVNSSVLPCLANASDARDTCNETLPGFWVAEPVYDWGPDVQGIILSALNYGSFLASIPGGYMAGLFAAKRLIGASLCVSSILNLLVPYAADAGVALLIVLRVVQGVAQIIVVTSQYEMWLKWAPPMERNQLIIFSISGTALGSFCVLLTGGFLCKTLGWPSVFYISGGIGCACVCIWFPLVYDDPQHHPFISAHERDYIVRSLAQQDRVPYRSLPIKAMMKSLPLWSILVSHFSVWWHIYILVAYLPTYLHSVLAISLKDQPHRPGFLCLFLSPNQGIRPRTFKYKRQPGSLEFRFMSGWFPEAYVKPLEEVPVNPMNALNPVTSMNALNPMTSINPMNPVTSMNPMNALNPVTSMNPMNALNPVTSMNPMNALNPVSSMNPMNALNPVTSMNPMNALNPVASMNPINALNPVTSMNPMSPMNELPSRSYPLRGSHSLDDLLDRPGSPTAPAECWDGRPRSRTPSRAPSPAPTPLPGSRRSSMGSMGVASDLKKLMSWEQHPPELFPRGTNPFATVKLRPTVTNDRSAPLIR